MRLFTLPLAGGSDAVAAGEGIYQQYPFKRAIDFFGIFSRRLLTGEMDP